MRLRLRYSDKQTVVTIGDSATLIELLSAINENASEFDETAEIALKFGYPPRALEIEDKELTPIAELGIHNGEVVIVDYVASVQADHSVGPAAAEDVIYNPEKVPYVDTETGYVVLEKVPDDNSCLFHAIIRSAGVSDMVSVHDLRSVVSNTVKENKDGLYSEAILGKPVQQYCEWILNPQAWGGEIEIDILAKFLNVEIITVDIESKHDYKFNEQAQSFVLLAYSGVHYDSIMYQRHKDFTKDLTRVGKFDKGDLLAFEILESYKGLVTTLNVMGYFTNTLKFNLKCGECDKKLVGERDASEHASETGHSNFQEYH